MSHLPTPDRLPVAIIGAGPIGLAAAAHLTQRGLPWQLFEAGATVASHWQGLRHVRLFSPWRYNLDPAAAVLLEASGWRRPDPDTLPLVASLLDDYLLPLGALPQLRPHIQCDARVVAIGRQGLDKVRTAGREQVPFVLRVLRDGRERDVLARAVIDATGTWGQPNPAGAGGLPAPGEAAAVASGRLQYGMPDVLGAERQRYIGRHVLVVGAGHSAAGTLLALAELAEADSHTRISWAVRGTDLRRLFGGGERDGLPARGALGQRLQSLVTQQRLALHMGFQIAAIDHQETTLRVQALDSTRPAIESVEQIVVATGSRPDLTLGRELRLQLDPWLESTPALAPLIDPNEHSCGTVRPHGHRELAHPESGYYTLGAKSYGRAPNFLMATGYEQARSVVAALAGDRVAADAVQLDLPETGVCSVDLATRSTDPASTGCCGGPPPVARADSACCVADARAQDEGRAGCGCSSGAPVVSAAPAQQAERTGCCAA